MKTVLITLPTYKEYKNLKTLIPAILKQQNKTKIWEIKILVVDSNSNDKTDELVKEFQKQYQDKIYLLETPKEGLGKAYYKGFKYALEKIKPYAVFEMDADWSHNPDLIPEFLKQIEKGNDFVIGSRYIKGGSIPDNWGFHRKIFSVLGNLIIKFGFAKPNITDWTSGYRCIKSWVVKQVLEKVKKYNSYVFQIAILDNALKNNARITEIPLNFKDREEGFSKINSIQYILHTLFYVFTHSPFLLFIYVGSIGFIVDFSTSWTLIHILNFNKVLSNGIGAETAIFSNFMLNNFFSFRHKKIQGKLTNYIKGFLKFNLISIGNVLVQMFGLFVLLKIFGDKNIKIYAYSVPSWIIYKVLIIIFLIIPLSYFLYNKIIWKK
ncbi:MAG: glycosyl transferase [Patescibacteria group bacterium]|nr:MAG: glycosyl transferase [Patescibacteria group bacterium]